MSDLLRSAMTLAADHGMTLVQSPDDPGLANIRCRDCGWPGRAFDARLVVYAKHPHGCVPCRWEAEHNEPCPNYPPRAERPDHYAEKETANA